jgi:hypothetical protein
MSKAATFTRPLDQTRNIGDDILETIVKPHDAEIGFEGREGIVSDLRLRRRNARDQRGFTDVGISDERNVSHELDLEIEPALLANLALFCERRGPTGVRKEAGIALASLSTSGSHPTVTLGHEISKNSALSIENDRSFRYVDEEIVSSGTVLLLA